MVTKSSKVGILTLNGYKNYGNRLQNYATQEVLRSLGFQVETILVDRKKNDSVKFTQRLSNIFTPGKLNKKFRSKINRYLNKEIVEERRKIFVNFTRKYINETDYKISSDYLPDNLSDSYDFFITGSDQVWNPYNLKGTSYYFLTFSEKRKRIAFAASFGISEIPDEYRGLYRKWLNGMYRIAVREEAGAKIVKNLTGYDVPVLVDPTMMLTKKDWLSIAKPHVAKPENNYILTYFLGDISDQNKRKVQEIAKTNKLEVIDLMDISNKEIYTSDPSEFVDLINSASLVFTDSFHGTVFSIIMQTPFFSVERKGVDPTMFSRLENLLKKFKFENRKWNSNINKRDVLEVDFSHVKSILDTERAKAFNYIKEAIDI
ncbi:polysaccharide pyruvyl transferase family protein [Natranaerobius trueperi]|uniref:Polysaccharide pyruvyl transferase domain-containing protein n=1 Tax=Natranaerobius trueperi TaxID=759412 RepID=A0A226BWS4_9FIRM|nr:polysaccharide pyruvyl transferase family protein [Natranaerobius trueperi]OWZ83232.1 hypothetical protein CDO51_09635 [Natranaerobius trueperi]